MDGDGLATSTQLLTGKKYWVAFYQDPKLPKGDVKGDVSGIECWPPYDKVQKHDFRHYLVAEAIVLSPRDML